VREALIDPILARRFYPNGGALGAKIPFGGNNQFLTVVGVVEQARQYDVHADGRPQMYVRAEDGGFRSLFYVLRTDRDPGGLVPDVRTATRTIDARLAIANVRPMQEIVGDALRQQRISAVLIAGFALGALLLAGMGLFGVVAGSVTRRRHELAVRLAVGADHGRLLRLVLREGAFLVGVGILVGVPGVYFAGNLLRGVLVGVSPTDPATLVAVALGLSMVAMVACYLPARRVLGIDPAQSLRQE
jgi:putative ABC transport system permease protein